ncbi:ribbon-helix-helix protein, CopG family [Lentzea cavernae]|nr:ribbon-helix-helix protein, CopG family [Lentzea cavernae]
MAAAEKMEQYKFRERPSRMKRVQAIAEHRGDNVSELIRDALKDYVRAHDHELPRDEGS